MWRTVCYDMCFQSKRPRSCGGPWHANADIALSWAQYLYDSGMHVFIECNAKQRQLQRYLPGMRRHQLNGN